MDEAAGFLYFSIMQKRQRDCALARKRGNNQEIRRSTAGRKHVPVFSLYGEEAVERATDFVHIEDIRTRSEHYGWQIGSHRHHGLLQTVFVRRGRVTAKIDNATFALKAPCLITLPPSTVHEFHFSTDTVGQVLTIAHTLFRGRKDTAENFATTLFAVPRAAALARTEPAVPRMQGLLDQIAAEFRERNSGASDMLEWLVAAVLLLIARLHAADHDLDAAASVRADIFNRFRTLVEAHYLEHRPVAFYATKLGVGTGRLNRACRAAANCSAFDLLQDRLLLEARRKLTYIAAPVSLLAYELGFDDPAYFWRFFRRRTGLTPKEFRQRGT